MKTAVLLLLCCLPVFAKTNPQTETAKVISQDISAQQGGYAMMPIGTSVVGMPINHRSNLVIVETASHRLTWAETGNKAIVLPVNGEIKFYRDGDLFIVMDSKNKKHKFALMHMETIK